jgi:hypothetical protein
VKTMINFMGQDITFPQLYLIDILNNIRYAVPVERVSFPDKWRRQDRTRDEKGTTKPFGGQGARERSNNTYIGQRGHHGGGALAPSGQLASEAIRRVGRPIPTMPRVGGAVCKIGSWDGWTPTTKRKKPSWTHIWNALTGVSI